MKDAKDNDGHSIKILGRAGLLFKDREDKYFVDSEMLVGPQFDFVIYTGSVRPYDKEINVVLSAQKKDEIIKIVIKLLQSENIRTEIRP